jgi:hypothetical protein
MNPNQNEVGSGYKNYGGNKPSKIILIVVGAIICGLIILVALYCLSIIRAKSFVGKWENQLETDDIITLDFVKTGSNKLVVDYTSTTGNRTYDVDVGLMKNKWTFKDDPKYSATHVVDKSTGTMIITQFFEGKSPVINEFVKISSVGTVSSEPDASASPETAKSEKFMR